MDQNGNKELSIRGKSQWPNMFILPREIRDAIPHYGARALVFDSVRGSTGPMRFDPSPRAQVQFIVHETGKLKVEFTLFMDLDSTTTRALGQFLIDLADRAEAQEN